MNAVIRANALKSTAGSLVPNVGLTWLALRSTPLVALTGPAPNLLTVLLPAMGMTALATTLLTFSAIAAARRGGQLSPPLPPAISWWPAAGLASLGLGGLAAGLAAALGLGLRPLLAGVQATRTTLVLATAALGLVVALVTALLAARRARRLGAAWNPVRMASGI